MMPVDQYIKTNRRIPDNDFKSNRYYGHQPNPLFNISDDGDRDEQSEVCPCCKDKNYPADRKEFFIQFEIGNCQQCVPSMKYICPYHKAKAKRLGTE